MEDKKDAEKTTTQPANPGSVSKANAIDIPSISLPKGGGSIKSIDEKFSVNAVNGTAGFNIPFPFSPSRNAFMPALSLSYNSGNGNSIFGLGWNAEPTSITRKTDRKLPEYNDAEESDVFIFSGIEDLVPELVENPPGHWDRDPLLPKEISRYKPRVEGGFARIEKISETNGNIYWKIISKENVISIFGKNKSAQICHPKNETKIFKWLLEFSCDDKGNCFQFEYEKDDETIIPELLHEKNRLNGISTYTNTYLKRIKYCNKTHFNRDTLLSPGWEKIEYLLELVLDYKKNMLTNPQPGDTGADCRVDPFSDYRSGFEIRTYRICYRVFMFHQFTELKGKSLIRSIEFNYNDSKTFSFLKSITQTGYKWDGQGYIKKSLPPVEFNYEPLGWNTAIRYLPNESMENLPVGIDDQSYQWIDLNGEGLSGILTEQDTGWYYKGNSGDGNFDTLKLISPKPAFSVLANGSVHFQDMEANGQKFLVSNDLNGYFEFSTDDEWLPFKAFNEVPNISLHDPNVKMLDLNGDGKADILITEDHILVWYPSKGKEGFDSSRSSIKNFDEEQGPNIVFADSTQSIVLADMSGDGLADIVRIRCNDIAYWPNLGYGKFGAKVSMSNAPVFDHPDHFNTKYIKLADIDGSGTTDIVYLANNSFKIYFNQSGNSWSEENIVQGVNPLSFPATDDHSNINIIDLLGNGTSCIVWSSPLPAHSVNPMRYIDLMNGKKPHIMTSYKNNMGKEVHMHYKPSTWFYLEDKKAGTPWITKLPFPVHCVQKVTTVDKITKTRFTNHYCYHHGYYDYKEREFRGFGRVDQLDTESFENYSKQIENGSIQIDKKIFFEPPIQTKTWFHTGAFLDKEKILDQFETEYYQNADTPEKKLSKQILPASYTTDEMREALRACKGMPLHVEIYSLDKSKSQNIPYTTSHHTCEIKLLQPKVSNQHAVFLVQESEALTYNYERMPEDPRIAHVMNIDIDKYGNVLKSAAISYGRKIKDVNLSSEEQQEQEKINIIYSENSFAKKDSAGKIINDADNYRLPVLWQTKNYELTGFAPGTDNYFSINDLITNLATAIDRNYEAQMNGQHEKRLIEHIKILFLKNDLSGQLPEGIMESLLLPFLTYKLALTPQLIINIFGNKVDEDMLVGIKNGNYFKGSDGNYWISSGLQIFDNNNFYQVTEVADPFGYRTFISYDPYYRFYIEQTKDALNNISKVKQFNFRSLSACLIEDMNNNRTAVRMDELGMVISSFVMGKTNKLAGGGIDPNIILEGDEFDEYSDELSQKDYSTNRLEYDLMNYYLFGKPNYVKTTLSNTHHHNQNTYPLQEYTSYAYCDGSGNTLMTKVQAAPGDALDEDGNGNVIVVPTNDRWIGNGRTILNNKGKPVKQYEPYFSINHEYEDSKNLTERGVTPIIIYDAAGRVIKTEMPDGTFTEVIFDSWMQKSYDQNDTIERSDWYDKRKLHPDPLIATPEEIDAAEKAFLHRDTPTISYLDSLGRNFLSIADNGNSGKYKTSTETDIEGNLRSVTDACENRVMQYKYDMLGNQLYSLSMDAGERWILGDIMGKQIFSWAVIDDRKFKFEYDELHRPTVFSVSINNVAFAMFEKIEYGEALGSIANMRGKPFRHYDTAGIVKNELYDFKGNTLRSSRQLLKKYTGEIDWADTEPEIFITETTFDALNRAVEIKTPYTINNNQVPDIISNIIQPLYTQANLLGEVKIRVRSATTFSYVKDISYNAKKQREKILYGNNTLTKYSYDEKTFRLKNILTTSGSASTIIQNIFYTYDPVGNIINIKDDSIESITYNGEVIEPVNNYTYDALYRLMEATGREHAGQNIINETNSNGQLRNFPFQNATNPNPNDVNAMRNYKQNYIYDKVGNIKSMQHSIRNGGYTRNYNYNNNIADHNTYHAVACPTINNQLLATIIAGITTTYEHDAHGSIKTLPQLSLMEWNFKDQLHTTQRTVMSNGAAEKTFYVYDAGGQRLRKITNQQNSTHKKEERIYFAGFEIYRSYDANGIVELQRETLHVMDDKNRIALVETKTIDRGKTVFNTALMRYQLNNHLGSACMELDDATKIISYEEYHPYGTTSLYLTDTIIQITAKRYRYTGMERDEESGLAYHSARYYIPWLGRWASADPIGITKTTNLYEYVLGCPTKFIDRDGKQEVLPGIKNKIFTTNASSSPNLYRNSNNKLVFSEFPPKVSKVEMTIEFDKVDVAPGKARYTNSTFLDKNTAIHPGGKGYAGSPIIHSNVVFHLLVNGKEVPMDKRRVRYWDINPVDNATVANEGNWEVDSKKGSGAADPTGNQPRGWDRPGGEDAPGMNYVVAPKQGPTGDLHEFVAGNSKYGGFYYQVVTLYDPDGTSRTLVYNSRALDANEFNEAATRIETTKTAHNFLFDVKLSEETKVSDSYVSTVIPDNVKKKKSNNMGSKK